MNNNLNIPKHKVYCDRNIIFKKYDREISHLIRLDFNIDIVPKEKSYFYTDKNGNKCNDVYYIDMSTTEFVVYNEDLKRCGNYDYNNEEINYYNLPLNKKIVPLNKKKVSSLMVGSRVEYEVIIFEHKKYIESKSGIVYDYDEYINNGERVQIGKWNNTTNNIDFIDEDDQEEHEVVKKIKYQGKKYLLSKKTGLIYDYDKFIKNREKIQLGKWNYDTNKIDFIIEDEEKNNTDDDILLKIALFESLNDLQCNENSVLHINETNNFNNSKIEPTSLSGIRAEERIKTLQNKYNIKQKPTEKKVSFQDEEMRKLLN